MAFPSPPLAVDASSRRWVVQLPVKMEGGATKTSVAGEGGGEGARRRRRRRKSKEALTVFFGPKDVGEWR